MRKFTFLLLSTLGILSTKAQNTNPWPSTGNVGVGTTSPAAPLHVVGPVNATAFRFADADGYYTDFIQNNYNSQINASSNFLLNWGNNNLRFEGNKTGKFYLSSVYGAFVNGWGGFNVALNEKLGFFTYGSGGFGALGANVTDGNNMGLSLYTYASGSREAIRILPAGNVGIGTASPVAPLHVVGASGSPQIRLAGSDGYFTDLMQNGYNTQVNASSNFLLNWGNNEMSFAGNKSGKFYLHSVYGAFVNGWGGFKVATTEKFGFYNYGGAGFNALGAYTVDGNNLGLSLYTLSASAEKEVIRVVPSGNTLIGTSTDNGSKLQVSGDIALVSSEPQLKTPRYSSFLADQALGSYLFHGDATSRNIYVGAGNGNNFHKFFFQGNGGQAGSAIANYNFTYHGTTGDAFQIYSFQDAQTKLLLSAPGNLILGGATDNTNKLQVNRNTWTTGLVIPTGAAAGKVLTSDANGVATWQTATGGGSGSGWGLDGNTVAAATKKLGTTDNFDLPLIANNVEHIRIKTSGKVGIGTDDPQAKLSVNGDINAEKVKVLQNVWPDYVFETSYSLPSLNEVEQYIAQNKHLPGVPSAKEIKEEGLNLGDNQGTLLKKIEELTLYVIAQQKEIEGLKKEMKEQQTKRKKK